MQLLTIIVSIFLFLLVGCEQTPPKQTEAPVPEIKSAPQAEPSTPKAAPASTGSGLFLQPISPQLMELPSEALAHWRVKATEKPALVLFSFDPLLKKIDPSLQERTRELALHGTPAELRQHGSFNTAEPLILPIQTVTAALDAGLFSKLYWIFPSKVGPEQLQLEKFCTQMQEQQLLTDEEIASIRLNEGVYTGQVRGIPFEAVHHQQLAEIPEPLVLHIEMGFFRGLYDNEIKSPLYSILRDTVDRIRARNWQPLVTTLSYSTLEGAVSLDVRFVISNLAEMLRNPQLLEGEMPQEWQLRSESLYAGDMYSDSKKIELAKQMVNIAPNSAAAHFDQFQALFLNKQLLPSLEALDEAVKRDPGYAAGYFELSQMAIKAGNTAMGLDLLSKAGEAFPENPFVPLQKAELLTRFKLYDRALENLAKVPEKWSTTFHENIPATISGLKQLIAAEQAALSEKE